jgi:hypothetical protein
VSPLATNVADFICENAGAVNNIINARTKLFISFILFSFHD